MECKLLKFKTVSLVSHIIVIMFFGAFGLFSQDRSECLSCHGDPDFNTTRNGKTVSLFIDESHFMKSAHKTLQCVNCHAGYNPYDQPHTKNKKDINCMSCHKNATDVHPFHPRMSFTDGKGTTKDLNCLGCHGNHYVEPPKKPGTKFYFSNLTNACGDCHASEKAKFLNSEHFLASKSSGPNTPNCIFCHTNPITTGFKLSDADLKKNQINLCLKCHVKEDVSKSVFAKSLINFKESVHGAAIMRGVAEAPSCVNCHGVHDLRKDTDSLSTIYKFRVADICGKCHIAIANEYKSSVHGIALKNKNPDAPSCTFCHGEHNIKEPPQINHVIFTENHILRTLYGKNKMIYCIQCHADTVLQKKYNLNSIDEAHDWLTHKVKHWEMVRCIDCHSSYQPPNMSHDILPPENTIKKCEDCHSMNSILMSKLFKHEKKQSREKYGFINGTILSAAYVIGTTRNVTFDTISLIIIGLLIAVIGIHLFLRWYFRK